MNRSNVVKHYRSAREAVNNVALKGAVAATALVPGFAFAQDGMSDGFIAEVTAGKADLWLLGGAVLGVVAIGFLISRGKKAGN